jgi:hypothetical protein
MVPLTVAALTEFADRTGADPTDEPIRRACMDSIVADGGGVSWPPSHNGGLLVRIESQVQEVLRTPHTLSSVC